MCSNMMCRSTNIRYQHRQLHYGFTQTALKNLYNRCAPYYIDPTDQHKVGTSVVCVQLALSSRILALIMVAVAVMFNKQNLLFN